MWLNSLMIPSKQENIWLLLTVCCSKHRVGYLHLLIQPAQQQLLLLFQWQGNWGLKKLSCFYHSESVASLWLISGVASIELIPNFWTCYPVAYMPCLFWGLVGISEKLENKLLTFPLKTCPSQNLSHPVNDNCIIPGAHTKNHIVVLNALTPHSDL